MKQFFTLVLILVSFSFAQAGNKYAVSKGTEEQLKTQAIEQTRELAVKLGLNEAEYIRVKNITFQKLVALKEAEGMYAHNAEMKAKKLQGIEEEFNQQLAAALSAKQHKSYMALVKYDCYLFFLLFLFGPL